MAVPAHGQWGYRGVYKFADLPIGARGNALAGQFSAARTPDLLMTAQNPALLDSALAGKIGISWLEGHAGSQNGALKYAFQHKDYTLTAGMRYANFGNFSRRDEAGTDLGNFSVNDIALELQAARRWNRWTTGATLRPIYSQQANDQSFGITADLGVLYADTATRFGFSLLGRNLGTQITPYRELREPIEPDIQAVFTKQPQRMPFRFSLMLHHLHRWDLTFIDPSATATTDLLTGEPISSGPPWSEKIFRHVSIGTELILGPGFQLQFAYNHRQRKEMAPANLRGLTGFSFGMMVRVRQLDFQYSHSAYSPAGSANALSLIISPKRVGQ